MESLRYMTLRKRTDSSCPSVIVATISGANIQSGTYKRLCELTHFTSSFHIRKPLAF